MAISISKDIIFSKRDNKLLMTSLNTSDQKIYTFEGLAADLIYSLSNIEFSEDYYFKISKSLSSNFTFEEWTNLLRFCLDEKIFINN